MKKLLCTILFLGAISASAHAEDNALGLGIILGEPTGISANYKFQPNRSVDMALAYDFDDDFYFHSTYLFRHPKSLDLGASDLGWYAGIGGRFEWDDHDEDEISLGVRGSLGGSLEFKKYPVEVFAELAPVMDIVEETDFDLGAALGARYYF